MFNLLFSSVLLAIVYFVFLFVFSFSVPAEHTVKVKMKVKVKESVKPDKYLHFAREMKTL